MTNPENTYEQLIEKRVPGLEDRVKKRVVRSLREIDRLSGNLARAVGPNIGSQLVLDLTSNRLSDLAIPTVRLTEEQLVDAEYDRANLRTASEKILSKAFSGSINYPYLVHAGEIDEQIVEWQAFGNEYPPYTVKASLLREVIKRILHPKEKQFYFHRLVHGADAKAITLLALFLNARGLYPTEAVSTTDYQAESEEIIETLKPVVVPSGEEVMGLFLAGRLTHERRFDLIDITPISVLDLSVRAYHALKRVGADTVEELEWLSLPENYSALEHIRNIGEKSLAEINERLSSYRRVNVL